MLVTIVESVVIARLPAAVWDFTQDYSRRSEWEPSIVRAEVLAGPPHLRVRVHIAGGLRGEFEYKLFDRPHRTSVTLTNVQSPLFAGGGGSWSYEPVEGGTRWTRTDSLRFGNRVVFWLLGAVVQASLKRATRRAMLDAKRMLETDPTRSPARR